LLLKLVFVLAISTRSLLGALAICILAYLARSRLFTPRASINHLHTSLVAKNMALQFLPRPSNERGHADHDWLKTYHTFSFASYQDYDHLGLGPLRVINEDRVAPGTGFGMHSHREFEIFSYIVTGELEHKDSLGNTEIMKRGDLQLTSVGTGVRHSEYNRNTKAPVHFLQIWAKPSESGLKPKYYTRHYTDEEKKDVLLKVVAPVGGEKVIDEREANGPTPIHSPVSVYASILSAGKSVSHTFAPGTTKALVHNIMTSGYVEPRSKRIQSGSKLQLKSSAESLELAEGDGVYINVSGEPTLEIRAAEGCENSEFILFEMS